MSKHITEKQRYAISKMLQVPMSKKDIAEAIGVDKSSIYREIKRNCDIRSGKYNLHIPEHTRSLSGSLLGYKTIP